MPDFEELIAKYQSQIEKAKSGTTTPRSPFEIPRNGRRRVWNESSDSDLSELGIGFEEAPSEVPSPPHIENTVGPNSWYSSFRNIGRLLYLRRRTGLILLALFMVIGGAFAHSIKDTYSSTLHLYAPDKIESISSRLQLYSNRIEFASFPLEFKVPISLIARQLKTRAAHDWVVAEFYRDSSSKDKMMPPLDPDSVSAEIFYAYGSELLVVQGYANSPELTPIVTNLYWKYLEKEVRETRQLHLGQINQWLSLTLDSFEKRIDMLKLELLNLNSRNMKHGEIDGIQRRLNDKFAELEVRRLALEKECQQLRGLKKTHMIEGLAESPDSEIQDILQIYREMYRQVREASSQNENKDIMRSLHERLAELDRQAFTLVNKRLQEKESELSALNYETGETHKQLDTYQDRQGKKVLEDDSYLKRQLTDLETYRDELGKLKSQMSVEADIGGSFLKAIQFPVPEPSTLRPIPAVKVALVLVGSLLLAFFSILLLQTFRPVTVTPADGGLNS